MSRRSFQITPELMLRAYQAGLFPMAETRHGDRLYWLDFAPDGTLTLALNASFDAADLPGGTGTRDYFVPDGCNDCHGTK